MSTGWHCDISKGILLSSEENTMYLWNKEKAEQKHLILFLSRVVQVFFAHYIKCLVGVPPDT